MYAASHNAYLHIRVCLSPFPLLAVQGIIFLYRLPTFLKDYCISDKCVVLYSEFTAYYITTLLYGYCRKWPFYVMLHTSYNLRRVLHHKYQCAVLQDRHYRYSLRALIIINNLFLKALCLPSEYFPKYKTFSFYAT